jgi:DNA (cytosine-5)-methyltransferase 1
MMNNEQKPQLTIPRVTSSALRPKCLDLFCCAGGAGMGYYLAGFDVVGVDIEMQPEYPFEFIQADAIKFVKEHGNEFDFIHASPPCQHFTKYNNCRKNLKEKYEDLIEPTRQALIESGKPYVIENVVGAPLLNPITLCGSMFGLDVRRHRLFESNMDLEQPKCKHEIWQLNRYPGGRSRERGNARVLCRGTIEVGRWNIPIETQKAGMGIDWISNLRKLSESIPPAYTKIIGEQVVSLHCW